MLKFWAFMFVAVCIGTSSGRRLHKRQNVEQARFVPPVLPVIAAQPAAQVSLSQQPAAVQPAAPVQQPAVQPAAPAQQPLVQPAAPPAAQPSAPVQQPAPVQPASPVQAQPTAPIQATAVILPQSQPQQPLPAAQPPAPSQTIVASIQQQPNQPQQFQPVLIQLQPIQAPGQPQQLQPVGVVPVQQIQVLAPAASVQDTGNSPLLQAPQQILLSQALRNLDAPRRAFAPGFEAKPIPGDQTFGRPEVQFIGAEQSIPKDQNLAVIRPQEEQQAKPLQIKVLPSPPGTIEEQEVRQRIQEATFQIQRNNALRDREAFLARFNVTGNKAAADEFIRQMKNLTEFAEKQPFANADVMKGLINAEISLAVDNWIFNEEIAGEMAATFNIPRGSAPSSIVLTPADIDEMHFAGNNPTASKKFHVQLQELLWQKIEHQYRVSTDLLSTLSDALLNLLVGNGIVKEKYGDDIAAYFYRASNKKIRLF